MFLVNCDLRGTAFYLRSLIDFTEGDLLDFLIVFDLLELEDWDEALKPGEENVLL